MVVGENTDAQEYTNNHRHESTGGYQDGKLST